jgi:hypothetical protein
MVNSPASGRLRTEWRPKTGDRRPKARPGRQGVFVPKKTQLKMETEDRGPATESPSRMTRGIRSSPMRCAYGVPLRSKKNEPKRIMGWLNLHRASTLLKHYSLRSQAACLRCRFPNRPACGRCAADSPSAAWPR